MYIISEIIGILAELYILHLFLQGSFDAQSRSPYLRIAAYGVFGILTAVFAFIPDASFVRLGLCCIGIVIVALYFFCTTIPQAIYSSIAFCALYVLTDVAMVAFFSLANVDPQEVMAHTTARAICITTSRIALLLLVLCYIAVTKRKRSAITIPFLLALSPGCIAGIMLGISFCKRVHLAHADWPLSFLIAAIGLLYLNIMIVFYAERTKKTSEQKHELELSEQHYLMQQQYYEQLQAEQENTRSMFHDINKHMQAMKLLVVKNDVSEAGQLLEDTQTLFDRLGNVVDVGNPVLSVILNEYLKKASKHQIVFDFDVSVPADWGISAVDAYVILGNTLDNAIDACSMLPEEERYIHLQMRTFHDILFCKLENPYKQETPKPKEKTHGYGLQNVRKCVEKYNGDMSIEQDSNLYRITIRLNQHH